jgi:hypothetical protein
MIHVIALALAIPAVCLLYWQPSFGSGGSRLPPEKSPKERYIERVEQALTYREYLRVSEMLSKPEFPLAELPVGRWRQRVAQGKERMKEDLKDIKGLEKILRE